MVATVAGLLPTFQAKEQYAIKQHGKIQQYIRTVLDRDTQDFVHLYNQEIIVDGILYRCRAIERFLHCPPWYRGESIGLIVEPV